MILIRKSRTRLLKCVFMGFVVLVMSGDGVFGWFSDPRINTPIWPGPRNQIDHRAIPDGSGGMICVWAEQNDPNGTYFDIYAQRLDSLGMALWPEVVSICTAPDLQGLPHIVSDGLGGAIIAWHDTRDGLNETFSNFDLYAQRITADGDLLWAADGVVVCAAAEWQVYPDMISDEMGGAIIVWDDGRSGDSQVYVQRINADGNTLWQADGILIANLPHGQTDPVIEPDGFGGALVVWSDMRSLTNVDVYAQRIDPNGNRLWGEQGTSVSNVVGNQFSAHITTDQLGGGIISWIDDRTGDGSTDIYAQWIDADGNAQWSAQGVPVCEAAGSQARNAIVSDGIGGAIITWEDGRRLNGDTDIYAQRITSLGTVVWQAGGKAIAATDEVQIRQVIMSDGAGGAYIAWQDFYRGGSSWNIYAQHITEDGSVQWEIDGIAVSIAEDSQSDPLLIPDGSGGSIIVWYDNREGTHFNIFAQQVDNQGILGGGKYQFFTANTHGFPQTTFSTDELILFEATWANPAPTATGSYQAQAAMSINSGTEFRQETISYNVATKDPDLTGDGKVNLADYEIMADEWLGTPIEADLDYDGYVDVVDLYLLITEWLESD